MSYSAREDYQSDETAEGYESRAMYSGFLGRRRVKIENKVIGALVDALDPQSVILDCPCGNGRWQPVLEKKASKIIGRDISKGMIKYAQNRAKAFTVKTDIALGDAENIDLADNSVDYTFSYALMKHLPVPNQYNVMAEFARVSRKGVICSFAVLSPLSWMYWRSRRQVESFPVIPEELEFMGKRYGLELEKIVKVSQPIIGLEYFAVFKKV